MGIWLSAPAIRDPTTISEPFIASTHSLGKYSGGYVPSASKSQSIPPGLAKAGFERAAVSLVFGMFNHGHAFNTAGNFDSSIFGAIVHYEQFQIIDPTARRESRTARTR